MDRHQELQKILEALLFVSETPVSLKELAESVEKPVAQVQEALSGLTASMKARGIRVQRVGERYHLVSAPEFAREAAKLLNKELRGELTPVAVETLAIVAYKQPVTKAEIENVRGINSDYTIRQLTLRGLIEPKGRRSTVGKPVEYGTTSELLNHLGITDFNELPSLPDIPQLNIHETQE